MPKTFPIMIEVEEIALGPVLRRLHEMAGIAKLHLQLGDGGKNAPAKRLNGGDGNGGNLEQRVMAMLMDGPKKAAEIGAALGKKSKAYGALHALKKKGLVDNTNGMHRLSRKAMAALQAHNAHPVPALPAPSKTPSGRAHPGDGPRAVFAALKAGPVARKDLLAQLTAAGMPAKSIQGVLARARVNGIIKHHGDLFELTAKGLKQTEAA